MNRDRYNPQPGETFPQLTPVEVKALEEQRLRSLLMRLVAINAYAAYNNTIVGNPAPAIRDQFERTTHPKPGDVVLETSTVWKWARHSDEAPRDEFPALGVLLRVTREPIPLSDGEEPDDATEEVVYIRPLDGHRDECRWVNATFIRVLSSMDEVRP